MSSTRTVGTKAKLALQRKRHRHQAVRRDKIAILFEANPHCSSCGRELRLLSPGARAMLSHAVYREPGYLTCGQCTSRENQPDVDGNTVAILGQIYRSDNLAGPAIPLRAFKLNQPMRWTLAATD